MKTIIEEAIDSFNMNHDDRCIGKCNHAELIKRAQDYEKSIEKTIRSKVAQELELVRKDWIVTEELRPDSYAAQIDHILGIAIKFAKG